jgi:hypothetical protein
MWKDGWPNFPAKNWQTNSQFTRSTHETNGTSSPGRAILDLHCLEEEEDFSRCVQALLGSE